MGLRETRQAAHTVTAVKAVAAAPGALVAALEAALLEVTRAEVLAQEVARTEIPPEVLAGLATAAQEASLLVVPAVLVEPLAAVEHQATRVESVLAAVSVVERRGLQLVLTAVQVARWEAPREQQLEAQLVALKMPPEEGLRVEQRLVAPPRTEQRAVTQAARAAQAELQIVILLTGAQPEGR
jgi:hypothetical protein